jgi:hypothetical protein
MSFPYLSVRPTFIVSQHVKNARALENFSSVVVNIAPWLTKNACILSTACVCVCVLYNSWDLDSAVWYSDSLRAGGFGFRTPMEMRKLILFASVRTVPGVDLASCTVSLQVFFSRGKRPASSLASTLRMSRVTPPLPHRVCMSCCGMTP